MANFADLCQVEMSKAKSDPNHVGGVCRINKNDKFLITFHNDSYATAASPPMMGETPFALASAPRIPPVKETIKKEMAMMHEHQAVRDFKYWSGLLTAATNNQTNVEFEALALHRERLKFGLDDYERCESIARQQQMERLTQKKATAKDIMKSTYNADLHKKFISEKTQEAYSVLQLRSLEYSSDYAEPRIDNTSGGHAEEKPDTRMEFHLRENLRANLLCRDIHHPDTMPE